MKKFMFAALFVTTIVGFFAGSAQAQCSQVVFSEVADHWAATKRKESQATWRIGIIGKMKSEASFNEYFIPKEPMEQRREDFIANFYVGNEATASKDLKCIGGTAKQKGQWFVCKTSVNADDLPDNTQVFIKWNRSDVAGGDCGVYGPMAIKLDENNNFIPDDHPADNQLPKPPAAQQTDETVDSDGDGVADSSDNCDDTPEGTDVDSNGCPVQISSQADPDIATGPPQMPAGFMDEGSCTLTPAATANSMLSMIAAALASLAVRRRR
jgi:hypothetical protein